MHNLKLVISIAHQCLHVVERGHIIKTYPVSTAAKGVGQLRARAPEEEDIAAPSTSSDYALKGQDDADTMWKRALRGLRFKEMAVEFQGLPEREAGRGG